MAAALEIGERARGGSSAARALRAAAAGLAVFALAWLSYKVTLGQTRSATLWPANAVIVACLIRSRPADWPAYLAAGFVGNLGANVFTDNSALVSVCLALFNSAEILACSAVVRRLAGAQFELSRQRHLLIFAAAAAATSAATALAAASLLSLSARHDFMRTLGVWTRSDLLGLLIVTPALVALSPAAFARFFQPATRLRNLALLALVVATTVFTFAQPHNQVRFLVFTALILLAFKGETAGAAIGVLLVGLVAVALSAFGLGPSPLTPVALEHGALMLQIFLLACVGTAFPVAAAIERRRQLEDSLAARAHDFQVLADYSTDIILRIDRDDRVLYVSPSCRRFGFEPEELVGRIGYELVHPDDVERVRGLIADLFSGRPVDHNANREHRLRAASGEWIWMEGSPQVVRDEAGQPIEVVSQLRDVSARKAAEQALAESEAKYRLLADRSTDIILRTDAWSVIQYVSPACRQLGYEPEEMVGRPIMDFVHPEDREAVGARADRLALRRAVETGERREQRVRRKDGRYVWLEGNPSVLTDPRGEVVGAISSLRDVSERRALEEALEAKRAEAEAAAVAKSEFLANMSHEIRTPLTGIIGFAGLLGEVEALPDPARTCVDRIATASQTLLAVVNDILDFSKMEAGQIELDPHPFEPASFIADTLQLVQAQADAKRLDLVMAVEGPTPPAVMADSSRLRQVLLNLLTNAIKFTEHGAIEVRLAHQAEAGGRLKVTVADSGAGIPADQLDRLFQRFSQADGSISRRFGGTGLGLAICKSLVELMGGEVGVESALGAGSTFWFTIAAPQTEPLREVRPAIDLQIEPAEPARILVVDDVEANRELVCAILSVFGHELTQACSGAEAVEAAIQAPFDLILMDLQMPGMDGLTATRAIRAASDINRSAPIVALSANVMQNHLDACREAGMDDHVGKPIDPAELLTKVARWTAVAEARAAGGRA